MRRSASLNFPGRRLFRRLKGLQQLADVGRVQGINALAIDALIFAALASPLKQEAHRLVALRTDERFRHGRSGLQNGWVHRRNQHALEIARCKAINSLILLVYYTHFVNFW
jgi:hypothetical protein